ncbi:MAG: alpha/beta fold hydrolase [Bdellovibrionaceae bacterium]|nr:alpha/beta fold hydrolase [Pseudobdellovibrionaceae bacterium]
MRQILALLFLFPVSSFAHDICAIEFTLLHYFQGRCADVRPEAMKDFTIHSVLLAKDLSRAPMQETVVLVPGGPGSSAEPLKTALQKREIVNGFMASLNVNVVMFDPRGTGMSPLKTPSPTWTADDISTERAVEDLLAVIDEHSPGKPVILFAHSAGGHVALRFAQAYPARVKGLFLVSVSTSPRRMAVQNIKLMGAAPLLWEESLARAPALASVAADYLRAEDLARQQLKARLLNMNPIPNFRVLTPMVLRQQLILRMNQDPSGAAAIEWIRGVAMEIDRLQSIHGELVPRALRDARLRADDLPPEWLGPKAMIQRLIMGGEGVLAKELASASVYDGITLGELWGDYALPENASAWEPQAERINTPTVFLAGGRDVIVPPASERDFAARMPKATHDVVPEADHDFFPGAPMAVFSRFEKFLNSL